LALSKQNRTSKAMFRLLLILVASCLSASADNSTVVLSSYHVSTNVNSRLMTTSIDMIFENTEDCSSVYDMTIQLPRNARVTDLIMDLSDGCQLDSQVKNLDDAVNDFEELYSEGYAAAILTAWDMDNYELQVSIPPNGITNVSLKYQELLIQKLDLVSFQVPMFPGIAVDDLKVDISVEDPFIGVEEFQIELQDKTIETFVDDKKASMHYEKRGVTQESSLPTLFHANYRPGKFPPENGFFLSDGECFTHVINPTAFLSSESMARKIVFVIDVSGSMAGQKLSDAKASFAVMIDTLDERDTLILQTFSNGGTENQWGPKAATPENKAKAEKFVIQLIAGGGTNLNDAFMDGIANVEDAPETVAPILVMMTDGQGSLEGNIIAKRVRNRNKKGKVKIFSIAFGYYADIDLLLGIAIQNGGRAVRIYEGFGDASDQMELFYKQELGTILMSDVSVSYDFGEDGVSDSTVSTFPVYAAGSEIVVRGRMDSSTALNASRSLKSVVSANSAAGPMEWPLDHIVIRANSVNSDCRQSFAQARIVELLEYRDAYRSIGDELLIGTPVSRSANHFEEEARKIALDAGLVWPGLTALVTVENANCQQNKSDVCYSGVERENDLLGDFEYGMMASSRMRFGWSDWFSSISLVLIALSPMVLMF
jgi:uncharacterized protein YegL